MNRWVFSGIALFFFLFLVSSGAQAANYYVSPFGDDANSGLSPETPWRTPSRVNRFTFRAGDRILFQGGARFVGGLLFDSADTGTPESPIQLSSYGTGRAVIDAGDGTAFSAYNCGGYFITNLNFIGSGRTTNTGNGISFYTDLPGGVKLDFVRMDNVDVSGFGKVGITIGGGNGTSGFRNVSINNAVSHDNGRGGILTFANSPNVHENVYVGRCTVYNNSGVPGMTTNTGNGIVLGCVNGGTIERSIAHDNGWLCDAGEGPVGIWAYYSNAVIIQYNESYNNRTGGGADGGGFDLDVQTSNSILQYNYSHNNDGAGYLLAHFQDDDTFTGNTVRYNISENDGRKNAYAGITVWGRILNTEIYHNTVYQSPTSTGTPAAIYIHNSGIPALDVSGLHIRNNILQTAGGMRLVEVSASQLDGARDLLFQGNDYYSSGSPFQIAWGSTYYASFSSWRSETGQEHVGSSQVGFNIDPRLVTPGGGGTINNPDLLRTLEAYKLQNGSLLIDAGLNLNSLFGTNPGRIDFYGNPVPRRLGFDVGAFEAPPLDAEVVLYAAEAPLRAGNWQVVSDSSAAGGLRIYNPDAGAAKIVTASANPTDYFEISFTAQASTAYHLWMRGKAQNDFWGNDSVFVQFSDSVDGSGTPTYRIGTTAATEYNLEDCSGCGLSGWGWQDNGWGSGVMGPAIYFQTSGMHTLRVQVREDGLSLDQIILSSSTYLNTSPGALRNDTTILPRSGDPPPPPSPTPTITGVSPNSGTTSGGATVTISGSNFTNGANVSFGGAAATNVNVINGASITAVTPAHSAGAVNIVVTNPDGQSGTLANGYTYVSSPPTETVLLADDFNDNSLDPSKWSASNLFSGYTDSGLPAVEMNQQFEIGAMLTGAPGSHYNGIRSVAAYNFTGAYCYVALVRAPATNTTADAMLTVGKDVDNYYRIYVEAGALYLLKRIQATKTTLSTRTYDAGNHRYLRIRHDNTNGNVVFEAAPDGGGVPGTWTVLYSETWNISNIPLTTVLFELKAGTWQSEMNAPGKVVFDNFKAASP